MAVTLQEISDILDTVGVNYDKRDENTIAFPFSDNEYGSRIVVVITLKEDGEYLNMRTVSHLDDLVAEASEEKRNALLQWMLHQNYRYKLGSWEYDPTDHDHHYAVSVAIEDGQLTERQFVRLLKVILDSAKVIPTMKEILGVAPASSEMSEIESKRQELLAQLRELEEQNGI